tara:strand:- start:3982 stop:5028 length:1047 start_codon:yes stop_codon:yes gene_type:complete
MLKTIIDNYFFKISFFPFSILYGLVSRLRNYLYNTNIIKTQSLPCKVISVGNITTGGSGKTPMVAFLAYYLKSIGKNVGIISRGYGRSSKDTVVVTDGITKPLFWEKFGDEAFLLSYKLDGIPIIVGRSKYQAGLKMINDFKIDVIIVDDGFQHRALHRDLDIVLINSKDTLDTHRLIPVGLLREHLRNLKRADLLVFTKTNIHDKNDYLFKKLNNIKTDRIKSLVELSSTLKNKDNNEIKISEIESQDVYLFSALGDNEGFRKSISKIGCNIVGHSEYPDHYKFKSSDLKKIQETANKYKSKFIITTEKDMVKIKDFGTKVDIYAVQMILKFDPEKKLKRYVNNLFS